MIYWDTSCVLKLYAPEPDSEACLVLAEGSPKPLLSSEVLEVELYYALRRKEMAGALKRGAAERLFKTFRGDVEEGRIALLPLGRDVIAHALELGRECLKHKPPVLLRSLDGIHLATARVATCGRIVTTDERMRRAAALLGLAAA
ncbi:MAG: type II toxin-antitoxin system VapC family toxin [Kiritimatiellae bacterium]|nr:type II toxin-antitoxin system VapC family toxin [Kiritimatiellia bacterium]